MGDKETEQTGILDTETAEAINDVILCYVQPVISIFGIMGNILSFIILFKERKRHLSNYMLVGNGLAASDTIFLITKNYDVINCIASQFDPIEARNIAIILIPTMTFVPVVLGRITGYITSLISLDRFIAFTWPFWFRAWVTGRKVIIGIVICYVTPVTFHIPVFLRNALVWEYSDRLKRDLPYVRVTDIYLENQTFFDVWKNLVLNILFYFLPVAVILCTTIVTFTKIRQMGDSKARKGSTLSMASNREKRATVTLILVCVIYVIASVPGIIMLSVRYVQPEFDFYGRYRNVFIVSTKINGLWLVLNSSINFVVYCFSVSSFRQNFLRLFCKKRHHVASISDSKTGNKTPCSGDLERSDPSFNYM